MATYLIDYENVNKDGLNGVSKLTDKDRVIIFYSVRADRMTFGLHRRLNETRAFIEYRRVDVGGHNALDFQLATYLGFLLAENSEEEYCIVSNDRGFEYLAGFWREPRYHVTRIREIATGPRAEERKYQKNPDRQHHLKSENELPASDMEELPAERNAGHSYEPRGAFFEETERTDLMVLEQKPDSLEIPVSGTVSGSVENHPAEILYPGENDERDKDETVPGSSETFAVSEENAESVTMAAGSENQECSAEESMRFYDPESEQDKLPVKTDPSEAVKEPEEVKIVEPDRIPENPRSDDRRMEEPETLQSEASDHQNHAAADKQTGFFQNNGKWNSLRDRNQHGRKKSAYKNREISGSRRYGGSSATESGEQKLRGDVNRYLRSMDLSDNDREEITAYIGHYKTKLGLNNALVRKFGTQKAGEIYKMIKPLIGDKKGSIEKTQTSPEEKVLKEVAACVGDMDLTADERTEIASFVQRYKTRQGFNNALVRRFGSQKAGVIYKQVKPLLSGKKDRAGSTGKKISPEEERITVEVRKLVSGVELTEEDIKEISSSVFRYKTRQGVNNALVRRFRSQKAGELYKLIKPLLKEKKGSRNE